MTKPIYDLQWATNDVTTGISGNPNKLEPFDFKAEGQQEGQPVPRQYLNFQFDALRQWKDYLEDVTDTLLASSANYLLISNNLSDLNNVATARTNLGLSAAATYNTASLVEAQTGTSATTLITPQRATDHFNNRTTTFTRTLLARTTADAVRSDLGLGTAALAATGDFASSAISIVAGNGLSGGGTLAASRTVTLGTPSTVGGGSTNSVTATSHTHAISLTTANIPNLDASKITSGTFPSARLSGSYAISITGNAATVTNGVYTTGNQTVGGTKTFSSTVFAPSFRISSDPELKDNMVDHDTVDNIELIKLKQWVWSDSEFVHEELRGKPDSGVDASVVEKVFPSCVERDSNGKLTVDYGKLAVHLILAKGA